MIDASDLSAEARAWFDRALNEYELQEHHQRLLLMACRAWDRAEQARKVIAAEGLTYIDRHEQPRTRPEVDIEVRCRRQVKEMLRELALDVGGMSNEHFQPPRITGNAHRRKAAETRTGMGGTVIQS